MFINSLPQINIFTCGRRPAGLLATLVVVVVGGGGITFIHGLSGEPMYGFEKINSKTPYLFLFYFKSPCMVWMLMYGRGGHTLF